MSFGKEDWAHLKWPLLILVAVLSSGSMAIMASLEFTARAQNELLAARHRLDAAHTALASAEKDRENMRTYMREYGRLLERGIIGEERRMDWLEDLQGIRRQYRVPAFDYTISPQHPYALPPEMDTGYFEPALSEVHMQFGLLHEGQLMDFLDRLHSRGHGGFILNGCRMERVAGEDSAVRLRAACTGGWLTLSRGSAT